MNQRNKIRMLFKDTLIFALGSLGSKIILFVLVPLYTNHLTNEEYGIAELVITMSQLVIPLVSVNIFSAVIRYGLSKDYKREDVLINAGFVAILSAILCFAIRPLLGIVNSIAAWKDYLLVYSYVNILTSIEFNYLKTKNKNLTFAIMSIIQTILLAATNIILIVYCNMGVEGYLLANTIACGLTALITFLAGRFIVDIKQGRFRKDLLKIMIAYSAPLILNDIAWWAIHSSDKLMIEYMLDSAKLGLYTLASKIPSLMNVFIVIFSQAWGISSIKEIENEDDAGNYYSSVFKYYYVIAFGAALVLIGITKPFMSVYVGKSFIMSWYYVPILLASASFSAISSFFGSIYGALKKSINSMITTIIAGLVNIILNYIFILTLGVWGALIGTIFAYFTISTIRILDVKRYISIHIEWPKYVISMLIVVTQAVMISIDFNPYIISVISIILFMLVNWQILKRLLGKKIWSN